MVMLTFHGEPRSDTARDPHGVRWNVKGPLAVLGVLAATVGFINMAPVAKLTGLHIDYLHIWLNSTPEEFLTGLHHYEVVLEEQAGYEAAYLLGETGTMLLSAAVSLGLALAGAGLAYFLYNDPRPERHTEKLGEVRDVLFANYYQDEYQVWLAQDAGVGIARAADRFDQGVIDGAVNLVSSVSLFSGDRLRRVQTGIVSNYAALITLGLVLLLVAFGLTGGWF
jgi:NADH-quinone oxidoreductase subunit L